MSANNEKGRDRAHMSTSAERLGRSGVNELINWGGGSRYQAERIQKQHEQQQSMKVCVVGLRVASLPLSECVCDGLQH